MSDQPIDTASLGPAEPDPDAAPFDLWMEGLLDYADLPADDKARADRLLR